jgi:hypothetical protein
VLKGGLVLIAVATLISQGLILGYALMTMPADEGAFRFSSKNIRMKRDTVAPLLNLAYPVSAEKCCLQPVKWWSIPCRVFTVP